MKKPSLLSVQRVGKSFGSHRVLNDVSFDVEAGETHILAGENGAGKSTLIKILAGVYAEFEGEIRLNGQKRRFASPLDAARAGVSVIHQELSLVEGMSVAENIFLGREKARLGQWINRAGQNRRARELCSSVGLDIDVTRSLADYPLAVKNGIEIAKALAWDEGEGGRLLILDEPTSALNAREAERLFALMADLKKRRYGLIYISHKMDEIARLADRVTVLRDGRHVGTADACDLPRARMIQWMVGRELSDQFPPPKHELSPQAPARLSVRGLTAPGVSDVSLHVREGEILGIGGLQGCGASELLAAIFGATEKTRTGAAGSATQGEVRLEQKLVRIRSPRDAIRHGIAYLTNDRKATGLVLSLGIRQNIALASLPRLSRWGWVRSSQEQDQAETHRHQLMIRSRSVDQETGTLSGGNQQKVALAKWLATHPKVLLLDEPTRGVDVGAKHEIYELIRELAAQGIAVVLITSEMPELLALSDRILVMHQGKVSAEFGRGQATQEKILEAAMGAS